MTVFFTRSPVGSRGREVAASCSCPGTWADRWGHAQISFLVMDSAGDNSAGGGEVRGMRNWRGNAPSSNRAGFFFFISWRLITSQHCSGFCHTLKWISHGFTCVPHPDPPSHLPLHPISLGLPSAPSPSACLMHPTWAGDLFHPR